MIGGKRFWANSGEKLDCEGPLFVAQCKLVQQLSLESLTSLAIVARQQGKARGKIGIVVVKQSGRGGNIRRPALVVMTEDDFVDLHGTGAGEKTTLPSGRPIPESRGTGGAAPSLQESGGGS